MMRDHGRDSPSSSTCPFTPCYSEHVEYLYRSTAILYHPAATCKSIYSACLQVLNLTSSKSPIPMVQLVSALLEENGGEGGALLFLRRQLLSFSLCYSHVPVPDASEKQWRGNWPGAWGIAQHGDWSSTEWLQKFRGLERSKCTKLSRLKRFHFFEKNDYPVK